MGLFFFFFPSFKASRIAAWFPLIPVEEALDTRFASIPSSAIGQNQFEKRSLQRDSGCSGPLPWKRYYTLQKPKVLKIHLRAAAAHFHQITEVRQCGRNGIVCKTRNQELARLALMLVVLKHSCQTIYFHTAFMCQADCATR